MAHGGARKGAGRPKGAATKRTREIADQAATEGLTPLEYLLSVMRNDSAAEAARLDAAKAAAPYVHPRLSTVEVGNKDEQAFKHEFTWLPSSGS